MEDTRCPCSDCGSETNHNHTDEAEWYMVWDHVWQQALKHGPASYLCVGCLEARLHRKLEASDFNDVVLGNFLPDRFCRSPRLADRMNGLVFNENKYRAMHGLN